MVQRKSLDAKVAPTICNDMLRTIVCSVQQLFIQISCNSNHAGQKKNKTAPQQQVTMCKRYSAPWWIAIINLASSISIAMFGMHDEMTIQKIRIALGNKNPVC